MLRDWVDKISLEDVKWAVFLQASSTTESSLRWQTRRAPTPRCTWSSKQSTWPGAYITWRLNQTHHAWRPESFPLCPPHRCFSLASRHWQKDFSRHVANGKNIQCWFVSNNGTGLIDGSASDYIVTGLFLTDLWIAKILDLYCTGTTRWMFLWGKAAIDIHHVPSFQSYTHTETSIKNCTVTFLYYGNTK